MKLNQEKNDPKLNLPPWRGKTSLQSSSSSQAGRSQKRLENKKKSSLYFETPFYQVRYSQHLV
jgi:hypothetical protein